MDLDKIKFRGKRIDNGEWVFGYFLHEPESILMDIVIYSNKKFIKVIPETVGQFTGLKDSNGVEIYEGDLVQHEAWNYPFKIIFNQDKARFICEMKSGLAQYIDYERMIVIGNIHENK